jgi:uncharacterized protein YndB with AHSA1/START domain
MAGPSAINGQRPKLLNMYDIVHQLTIAATPERVYEAVTTSEGLATWWTTDVEAGPGDGELLLGFAERSVRLRLQIDAFDPPVLIHLTCIDGPPEWPGTQLAFRIEANDGQTVLRFWHGGWEYEDGALPSASFNWAMYLDSLRRALETGQGSPAS